MAELKVFHYRPEAGPVHRLDGRVKLLLLVATIVTIFSTGIPGLCCLSALLIAAAALVPLRIGGFLRELLVFGILAAVILISRPTWTEGAVAAWRFLLVVSGGMIFTATTGPEELHAVVFTLLSPIPRIPHGRIAEHVSLTILFIPLLFDTAKEIGEARKARMIHASRNPLRRLTSLAVPLMEAMFMRIEEVALALESRGYDEDVLRFSLRWSRRDGVAVLAGISAAAALILFA